jgi:hypothetical protein
MSRFNLFTSDEISALDSKLAQLSLVANGLSLRMTYLGPLVGSDSLAIKASHIRSLVSSTALTIEARALIVEINQILRVAVSRIDDRTSITDIHKDQRGSSGGWGRSSTLESFQTYRPTPEIQLPEGTELVRLERYVRQLREVCTAYNLEMNVRDLQTAIYTLVDNHTVIGKKPQGYYDSMSVLLKIFDDKKPDEHTILGICHSKISGDQLRQLQVLPINSKERKPSLVHGHEMRGQLVRSYKPSIPSDRTLYARFHKCYGYIYKFVRAKYPQILHGNISTQDIKISLQILRLARTESISYSLLRYLAKFDSNRVTTIPTTTSTREQIATVQGLPVYKISDCMVENRSRGWNTTPELQMGDVYLFGAQMYHTEDNESSAAIVRQIEQRVQSELERRERQRLHNLSTKQQLAKLFWSARKIEKFTIQDSYEVGNCRPGTALFCTTLGLDPSPETAVSGIELAKLWAKAKYPEPRLFGNVVARLLVQSNAVSV